MIQPYLDLKAKQTRIEDLKCEDGGYCHGDIAITLNDLEYMVTDAVGYWNDLTPEQQNRFKDMAEHILRQMASAVVYETCLGCGRDDEEICSQCRVGNSMPAIIKSSPADIYLSSIFSN